MRKQFLLLALILLPAISQAQSVTIYLCNDCSYQSSRDKETITFMTNGKVKINGKLAPQFQCRNNDGVVELKYKGKIINNLSWYAGQKKGFDLMDDRGIGYNLQGCSGNMPSMAELNNPDHYKKRKKKQQK